MKDRFSKVVWQLRKKLLGHLDEAEEIELRKLMNERDLDEVLRHCRDNEFLMRRWQEYQHYSSAEAYRDFSQRVKPATLRRTLWRSAGIAASIVLIAGLGWWWGRPSEMPLPMVTENAVIQPGINKAQLKLGDGSLVNVTGDSMQIREKKGADIKYTGGTISYEASEEIQHLVYNELIVPIAGECYVRLDDGTKVWVNADSRLKYPVKFVGDERKVFLEGQAYFEVAKATKPFIVHTGRGEIIVRGTSFDIKDYKGEDMHATLVSGKIDFKTGAKQIGMEPGEQMVVTEDGGLEKRKVNVLEYVGWKEGLYLFKDHRLEDIMNDLCRWYNVSVFYQNANLRNLAFTGNLKRYDNINTFMEVLRRTGDVKYQIKGNTIILFQ